MSVSEGIVEAVRWTFDDSSGIDCSENQAHVPSLVLVQGDELLLEVVVVLECDGILGVPYLLPCNLLLDRDSMKAVDDDLQSRTGGERVGDMAKGGKVGTDGIWTR